VVPISPNADRSQLTTRTALRPVLARTASPWVASNRGLLAMNIYHRGGWGHRRAGCAAARCWPWAADMGAAGRASSMGRTIIFSQVAIFH
jgi:hypothetical protein